jgi:hypothetical protein
LKAHFETFVRATYTKEESDAIIASVDWEQWVKQGGANPAGVLLNFTTEGAVHFENLADEYIALAGKSSPVNYTDFRNALDP